MNDKLAIVGMGCLFPSGKNKEEYWENTNKNLMLLSDLTKKQIKAFIESHNYEWASLTKTLDLLIVGEKPGGNKLEKAKKFGIPIKSWEEFSQELE